MNEKELARALNEHMHRFIANPEEYARQWQTVRKFSSEDEKGDGPSYGRDLAAYLFKLNDEAAGAQATQVPEQEELPFTD